MRRQRDATGEKRALERELVAVKSTVAALTEKLGKAGERLKQQQKAA